MYFGFFYPPEDLENNFQKMEDTSIIVGGMVMV
jgi:hypothetical protein